MNLRPRVGATVRPSGRVEVADTAGGGGGSAAATGVARVSSIFWDERPPCDRRARLIVGWKVEKTIPVAVDHVVPSALEVVPAEGRAFVGVLAKKNDGHDVIAVTPRDIHAECTIH